VSLLIAEDILERVSRMDVPFNKYGLDPYGISRDHLAGLFTSLAWFYRNYFNVSVVGMEHIPSSGPGFIIGNHSGGIPVDGGMILTSLLLDLEPPRLAHAMVEKFVYKLPMLGQMYNRFGQFAGLPEHAIRFLKEGRLVLAFPEGVRGIGKLYSERYQLTRFGTGFMRIALQAKAPIIPFAFVGGEEAYPVMFKLERLGKLTGSPFIPIPQHIVPFPKPVSCQIYFGEPMWFEGDGSEADEVIASYVMEVKNKVAELIALGRSDRRDRLTSGFETTRDDFI